MKVKVTTLTGEKHELEVAPQDTVRQIKVNIFSSKMIGLFIRNYIYKLTKHIYRPQRSWTKVIFLQACVCPRGGVGVGVSGPGGWSPIFWGGLQFLGGGLQFFWGVSNFSVGLQFFGGSPNFFFQIFFPQNSSGMHQSPPSRDGQCTAGTYPTGMHSCF